MHQSPKKIEYFFFKKKEFVFEGSLLVYGRAPMLAYLLTNVTEGKEIKKN